MNKENRMKNKCYQIKKSAYHFEVDFFSFLYFNVCHVIVLSYHVNHGGVFWLVICLFSI